MLWKNISLVLAIARLAEIFNYEGIFLPLREAVGIYHDVNGMPVSHDYEHRFAFFGALLSCYRCTSVWATFAILVLSRMGSLGNFIVTVFATNKVVLLLKEKGVI